MKKIVKLGWMDRILLIILCIVAVSLMFFSIGYAIYPYKQDIDHRKEIDLSYRNNMEKRQQLIGLVDTCSTYDSAIAAIYASQITIVESQDNLINDLRQETNNNIDKINALISFWVGIMGLLGVFVPLILQFRLHYTDKKLRDELDEKQMRLESLLSINRLNSFRIIAEHGIKQECSDRGNVMQKLWEQSNDDLEKMINYCFTDKQNENDETRLNLVNSLVHILVTVSRVKTFLHIKHRRRIDQISDKLNTLVSIIISKAYKDWETLHEEMKCILIELRKMDFNINGQRQA